MSDLDGDRTPEDYDAADAALAVLAQPCQECGAAEPSCPHNNHHFDRSICACGVMGYPGWRSLLCRAGKHNWCACCTPRWCNWCGQHEEDAT